MLIGQTYTDVLTSQEQEALQASCDILYAAFLPRRRIGRMGHYPGGKNATSRSGRLTPLFTAIYWSF